MICNEIRHQTIKFNFWRNAYLSYSNLNYNLFMILYIKCDPDGFRWKLEPSKSGFFFIFVPDW